MFIKQKSGVTGINIITFGLIVGAVILGNINDSMFLALLGACLFTSLVRAALKIYYMGKF
jgi:hypothetical protein